MGFGFITFKKKAAAEKALKTMQHSRLADHCLELKRFPAMINPLYTLVKEDSQKILSCLESFLVS